MASQQKGLLRGPKFSGKHSTVIDSAIPALQAAKECKSVSKIGVGIITPARPARAHIKFTETNGALKMQVRGTNAVQLFWLYTTEPQQVITEITEKWENSSK